QEALDKKLIDVIARDEPDLLKQLDGRTITRFNGGTVVLHTAAKPIDLFEMTLKQRVLGFLMDPNISFMLFALGLLAIFAEMNHPGTVIPGVVGVICILLAISAFNILPTRLIGVVLIFTAFAMFGLEVKFTSHGVLGIGGTILMVIGAMLLVDAP